jgi:hypothetical protein
MITPELLHLVAHANGAARAQAFTQLAAAAGDPAAYQVLVATLTSTPDAQVAFWCLEALIKHFGARAASRCYPAISPLARSNGGAESPAHRPGYLGIKRGGAGVGVSATRRDSTRPESTAACGVCLCTRKKQARTSTDQPRGKLISATLARPRSHGPVLGNGRGDGFKPLTAILYAADAYPVLRAALPPSCISSGRI